VAGIIAFAGFFVLHDDARYLFHGLLARALPLVILSGICGVGSLVLLLGQNQRGARLLAMGAVATVVFGWGVAQYPYILPTSLKLSAAAAPDPTLWSIVVIFVIAAIVILPSLGLLYYLDQRDLLETTTEPGTASAKPS
jgi:cytochrome d ubiquinol oxidase subunit II